MPKTSYWRIRFGLRTFLVVFTLLAVLLCQWTYRARRQRETVEWILANGGQVLYEYDRDSSGISSDGSYISNASMPVPGFILRRLDKHYFTTATLVGFKDSDTLDLSPLQSLKKMDSLILRNPKTGDLSPLANHPGLTNLVIENAALGDLNSLTRIPFLDSLSLENVSTTATTMAPIFNSQTLRFLSIVNCDFGDYSSLANMSNLEFLILDNTSIVDLVPLQRLQLKALVLCNVSTSDLSPLSSLKQAETIHLSAIPTQDISSLKQLPNLRNLFVAKMPVAQRQIDELQKTLPNCNIVFFPDSTANSRLAD